MKKQDGTRDILTLSGEVEKKKGSGGALQAKKLITLYCGIKIL